MKKEELRLGQRVKVINGGNGCRIADGITGIVTTRKKSINRGNYSGELEDINAELYVHGDDDCYYGLCAGYKIELLTQENE